jgi:hypothetical protein
MILRLSNAVARFTLLIVALVIATALAYTSVRNALAAHYSGLETRRGYERAAQLEAGNSDNWFLLGRYWQYNLDDPDAQRAIHAYRTALSLNPRTADVWLDLAAAYESESETAAAREAFLQAKRVYPLSAEVSWRYGNFLLRQNELPSAFREIRHSVALDPKRAAEAFSRCWRIDPDVQAILDNVLPPSPQVYLDTIRELDADAAIDPALAVWDRLLTVRPLLSLNAVIPFTDSLIQTHRIDDASGVWAQAVALSNTPPVTDPPGSVIWDGGFETGVGGGGFAWNVAPPSAGVQIAFDSSEKHTGQRSLRLGFDGRRNVNFSDVCHLAQVQPGSSYHFSAWVLTRGLTTDQGIRFHLEWLENSHLGSADTTDVHGTQPWTKIELPWTAAGSVHLVRVCIARKPSDEFGSRIHGTAWVDDVALVPEPQQSPQP